MMLRITAVGLLILSASLHAQASDEIQNRIDVARAAAERFTDRKVAIASGYRRVGRDLPSMGEHWINVRLLVDGGFDPAKPAILTYLVVNGKPQLTGVVFAVALRPGEAPPSPFGANAKWHEHNGSVDDEALLPDHSTAPSAAIGTRVAFLHAWLWIPAPEGMFAAENWAIPFVRAGIPVPEHFSGAAARAVSLASGERDFFVDLAGRSVSKSIEPVLAECATSARVIVDAVRSERRELTDTELRRLDALWREAMHRLVPVTGPEVVSRISGDADAHEH